MPTAGLPLGATLDKYNDFGLMAMNDARRMPAASTRSFRQAIAQRVEQEPKGAVERAKRGSYVRRSDRA